MDVKLNSGLINFLSIVSENVPFKVVNQSVKMSPLRSKMIIKHGRNKKSDLPFLRVD